MFIIGYLALEWPSSSTDYKAGILFNEHKKNTLDLKPEEIISFEAGIQAGQSYSGFFRSWTIPASYSRYLTYAAAKQIVALGHEATAVEILTHAKSKKNTPM